MNKQHDYSLRRRLLIRVWAPLFVVIAIGGIATFALARHIGSVVYDRWLYDSAMSLAGQIKVNGGKLALDLPKPALEMFEWDSVDRIYQEVTSIKQGRILSNAALPSPPGNMILNRPRYYDSVVNGRPVRIVAVMLPSPVGTSDRIFIQVAETNNKQEFLFRETILLSMPLHLGLLLIASIFIWLGVTSSLRTLDDIAARLAQYEPEGLVPVGIVDNVPTEVKPLMKSLNQLISKLSDAQNTQRRFVANAAHQLRTPLATLQVQTERALRESDPARHGEALSHVFMAVTRLRHVVHQLLTLARTERPNEPAQAMVRVDLARLARDELERWADAAISRDIDVGYDGPEEGIEIEGEPHLLRELIGNLVDNAIRYGGSGGEVTLGLTSSPVTLYVDDNGKGIPVEERTLVLERFYRRSEAEGDGCGLGLAIASEISARHQATLSIGDNPHARGARIKVVFSS
jgi:two-component system sensor histidine kinase TctE